MYEYRTREGQVTAADTETAITGLFGVSTTSAVQVPAGSSKIVGMLCSFQTDSGANAATNFAVKLSGDGLAGTNQIICAGGAGVDGTPASNGASSPAQQIPLDLAVVGSNQISIAAFMAGDSGTVECCVTLIFG